MLKIVLGVIAGFIAWSIMWVGSDQVLMIASPSWYGAHQINFQLAIVNEEPFAVDTGILAMHLVRAAIICILSGFLTAFIAGENRRAPLILGLVLIVVGIMFQSMVWNFMPLWYHFVFIAMLGPMTVLGGKLKASS